MVFKLGLEAKSAKAVEISLTYLLVPLFLHRNVSIWSLSNWAYQTLAKIMWLKNQECVSSQWLKWRRRSATFSSTSSKRILSTRVQKFTNSSSKSCKIWFRSLSCPSSSKSQCNTRKKQPIKSFTTISPSGFMSTKRFASTPKNRYNPSPPSTRVKEWKRRLRQPWRKMNCCRTSLEDIWMNICQSLKKMEADMETVLCVLSLQIITAKSPRQVSVGSIAKRST